MSRRGGVLHWWARVVDSVESRLWPLPLIVIVLSVLLGIALPRIDLVVDSSLPTAVDSAVFNGGADTARSVLSSIAGSLITATSLTFSLTVIALQLASTQASPRVLRLFARDRQVQWTLAAFLGTFAYSITVLRAVRSPLDDMPEFVPRISVTVAFVFTIVSVIMLIFFLAHLAKQLRVETMLKDIHADTEQTIRLVGERIRDIPAFPLDVDPPHDAHDVVAAESGFITGGDLAALVEFAEEKDIVIGERRLIGDNVVAGSPLARWWASEGASDPERASAIGRSVSDIYAIRFERTTVEDTRYGIQQIIDIALRALSPGVNDPTTAVHALGHLSAIFVQLVRMPRPPAVAAGPSGRPRVVTRRSTAAGEIEAALTPVRHYGASDSAVVARLLQLVDEVSHATEDEDCLRALGAQLDALGQQLREQDTDPATASQLLADTSAARGRLEVRLGSL